MPMTSVQLKTYTFVREFIALHGYSPSVREVSAHLGHKSTNATMGVLRSLIRRGFIKRTGKARSITLGDGEREAILAKLATLPLEQLRQCAAQFVPR